MFTPVVSPDQLPAIGTPEGSTLDCKAVVSDKWTEFRLARQVAAFANSVGGTLLIGAPEAKGGDSLKEYRPLAAEDAKRVEQRYGNAVKERCSPKPFIDVHRIPKDNGFVVAVNVWPFPGQAVGVRGQTDQKVEGKAIVAYSFPLRSGRDTVEILPEQLPMLMLPELRRTLVLLESIDKTASVSVTASSYYEHPVDLYVGEVDQLGNAVNFERRLQAISKVVVPLDQIDSVWKDRRGWRLHLRGQLKTEKGRLEYIFAPDSRRYQNR